MLASRSALTFVHSGISVFRNNEWTPETWHTILCFWAGELAT